MTTFPTTAAILLARVCTSPSTQSEPAQGEALLLAAASRAPSPRSDTGIYVPSPADTGWLGSALGKPEQHGPRFPLAGSGRGGSGGIGRGQGGSALSQGSQPIADSKRGTSFKGGHSKRGRN